MKHPLSPSVHAGSSVPLSLPSQPHGEMPTPPSLGVLIPHLSPQPEAGSSAARSFTAYIPVSLEPAPLVAGVACREEDHETCGVAMEHQL